MFNEAELELAIQRCREAVVNDSNWAQGLDHLAWVMGAGGCSFVNRLPEMRALLPASSRYAEFVKDFVSEGWAKDDLRAKRGWSRLDQAGTVLLEHDLTSAEERETMPVYRDLYTRHDLYWWASVSFDTGKDTWALSFLRSQAAGPFTSADARNMRLISPLLTGLVDLRVAAAQARADSAVRLLERMVGAALVVSDDLEIVSASAEALDILRAENLLTAQERLAPSLGASLQDAGDSPVVIRRASRRPILVEIVSDSLEVGAGFAERHRLLSLRDLGKEVALDPALLRKTFGLTRAEAVVAVHLARGQTLRSTAETLGISVETVRNQLRVIFAKTDTHRQPDLVSLMLRMIR